VARITNDPNIGNFEKARSVMGGDGMLDDMLSDCLVCV
jgi:hypothetical protein